MSNRRSDKLAWGVSFLVIGTLVLIDKLKMFSGAFGRFLQSPGTYFLAAGITFLLYRRDKTLGIVFTVIGVIIHSDLFLGWINMRAYQHLMLPIVLLVIGGILVLSNRRR